MCTFTERFFFFFSFVFIFGSSAHHHYSQWGLSTLPVIKINWFIIYKKQPGERTEKSKDEFNIWLGFQVAKWNRVQYLCLSMGYSFCLRVWLGLKCTEMSCLLFYLSFSFLWLMFDPFFLWKEWEKDILIHYTLFSHLSSCDNSHYE